MTEPTLEFIGRKLLDIQSDQRLQRMRFDIIDQRFSSTDSRLGGIEERLAAIESKLESIDDKLWERLDQLEVLIREQR